MDSSLPNLRENLNIYPEDDKKIIEKNWLIYDNLTSRFYQIGHLEYLILSFWNLHEKTKIIDAVAKTYKKTITSEHFDEFFQFLVISRLLQYSSYTKTMDSKKIAKNALQRAQSVFYFKFRLLKPDKILDKIKPHTRWFFLKKFHLVMLAIMLLGIFGIIQNFENYKTTFVYFFDTNSLGLWFFSIIIVKIIHEFSHAITTKHYGCSVPSMGVAIMIFWPVLFTDTTQAWSLKNRKQRILISSAGLISEIYIAAVCSVLWIFLPDGLLRSVAFMLSSTAWITSLLINANPFMRFDGYFVLSDVVKIPNLHQAASHYLNQYIDKNVFGLNGADDLPHIKKVQKNKLALFGFLIFIYRLFLATVIMVLIYNLAFKLLAITLMCVYLASSILTPLYKKLQMVMKKYKNNFNKKIVFRSLVIGSFLLFVFLVPWRSDIEVPAISHYENSSVLYADSNSVVGEILVKHGRYVKKDDVLIILNSSELDYQAKKASLESKILSWKLKTTSLSEDYKSLMQPTIKELEEKESEYNSVMIKKDALVVKAPHDGIVYFENFNITSGLAFKKNQSILSIIQPEKQIITGYIPEEKIVYFESDDYVIFYPEDPSFQTQEAILENVSVVGVKTLDQPYLASIYGGKIAVREHNLDNEKSLVTQNGVYSIKATVIKKDTQENEAFNMIVRGTLVVDSKPYSIGKIFLDFIYSGFLKYSSF